MTSSRELWLSFPPKFRAKPALNIDLDDLPVERTVGLIWQGDSDTLIFLLNIKKDADTKRKIGSSVASIFDPIRFLACIPGDVGCGGLERQCFGKKAMRLWFRTPAEPVIKL
jgi:hypothetical protein